MKTCIEFAESVRERTGDESSTTDRRRNNSTCASGAAARQDYTGGARGEEGASSGGSWPPEIARSKYGSERSATEKSQMLASSKAGTIRSCDTWAYQDWNTASSSGSMLLISVFELARWTW